MKTKKIDPNNKYNKYNQALLNQIVQIQKNKQKKLTTQFPNTHVAQQQNKILSSQDKVDTEIVNNEVQDSQPEIKVKKPLNLLKIDEKHILFNDKGLKFLYEEIESISFNNSDDMANLNNFMKTIKTWHFLLASKVEFGFFLSKVRELGYKSAVKVNFY